MGVAAPSESGLVPSDALNVRRRGQSGVDGLHRLWANVMPAGTEEPSPTLHPAEPLVAGGRIVGLEADHEAMLAAARLEGEVPAKIFLARVGGGLKATLTELLAEPAANVLTEAAVVDKVRLRVCTVEGGAVKMNLGLHEKRSYAQQILVIISFGVFLQ